MAFLKFYQEYSSPFSHIQAMPIGYSRLNELKQKCLERIKILILVEKVSQRVQVFSKLWAGNILDELKLHHPEMYLSLTGRGCTLKEMKARQGDRTSHFILAHIVVHLKNKKLTRWYTTNETSLFVCHFMSMRLDKRREFMLANKLCCESIPRHFHLKKEIKEVYKVSWKYVLLLVARRSVPLINGSAYLDAEDLHIVAASHRFASITSFLKDIRVNLSNLTLDSRFMDIAQDVAPFVERLSQKHVWMDYLDCDEVSLSSLSQVSGSFPPCMQRMYSRVLRGLHLRHRGRQQLIPFFRDMGLTLSDATKFFKDNFLKGMSEQEYNRGRYEYFIRYMYGEVGHRSATRCPDCMSVQWQPEQHPKDCHGCPLTTLTDAKQLLETQHYQHLTDQEKYEILDLVRSLLPSEACAAIFVAKHDVQQGDGPQMIKNPVQYYAYSRNMEKYSDIIIDPEEI